MNLHLIPNSSFLNDFIKLTLELCDESENRFIIVGGKFESISTTNKKIHHKNTPNVRFKSKDFYKLIGNVKQYENIFIHFLSADMCTWINENINFTGNIYWVFWGADLYTPYKLFANEIYDQESIKFLKKHGTFASTANPFINILKKIKYGMLSNLFTYNINRTKKKAIKRINYFMHYNPFDFEIVKQHYECNAIFLPFYYLDYDFGAMNILNEKETADIKKDLGFDNDFIVQIGHSASLSNNHISLLNRFTKYKSTTVSFLCPLSYGDKNYTKTVIELGRHLFGSQFHPLTELLSKDTYLKTLACVDVAYMNHLRSEAGSNIVLLLTLGKNVFMNEENNLYKYLIQNKIKVNIIPKEIDLSLQIITPQSNIEQQIENSNKIKQLFSREKAKKQLAEILNKMPRQ